MGSQAGRWGGCPGPTTDDFVEGQEQRGGVKFLGLTTIQARGLTSSETAGFLLPSRTAAAGRRVVA